MTGTQKNTVAAFLDTAGAFLRGGYGGARKQYQYEDDKPNAGILRQTADAGTDVNAQNREQGIGQQTQDITVKDLPSPLIKENPPPYINAPPPPAEIIKTGEKLAAIAGEIQACRSCALQLTRTNTVPGEGVPHPLVMFIGEGPGADEDASGRPFVGKAGQLLDKMLISIGLTRQKNCYIGNVVKCRPPGNRDPMREEIEMCAGFLQRQLEFLKPLVLVTLGKVPAKTLLNTDQGITRLRGRWTVYQNIPLLPTFHPSYLLRDETQKALAWEDLKMLCRRLVELDSVYAAQTEELRRLRKI